MKQIILNSPKQIKNALDPVRNYIAEAKTLLRPVFLESFFSIFLLLISNGVDKVFGFAIIKVLTPPALPSGCAGFNFFKHNAGN